MDQTVNKQPAKPKRVNIQTTRHNRRDLSQDIRDMLNR
jgi:hypothetical protein